MSNTMSYNMPNFEKLILISSPLHVQTLKELVFEYYSNSFIPNMYLKMQLKKLQVPNNFQNSPEFQDAILNLNLKELTYSKAN